jgi:two-component system chemotaxis sensor kinase CheA
LSNANIIDKRRHAFLEEAREVLVELESSLLELNERPSDGELVGRVFRSTHTIEGSGAMFGFDEVAAFTFLSEDSPNALTIVASYI